MARTSSVSNSAEAKRRFYYGWVVVAACLIIGTVGFTLRFSFGVFFKSLEGEFDLNRATTSGIMSVYMILCAAVAISGGWLIDRYGPRKVVAVMGFFTGLSLLLASQASALWHMYLSYSLLLAVGTGGIYAGIVSTASRWFVKRRGLAMAIVTSALGFGSVMQPVSAYLVSDYGWRMSYFILALVGFCVIIPLSISLRIPSSDIVARYEGKTPETGGIHLKQGLRRNEPEVSSLLQVLKTRNLWLSVFMWFSMAFGIFIIIAHIVPHAIDLGISATKAAAILSIAGAVSILGRLLIGRISDIIGRKKAAIIATLLSAVAMLWVIWASDLWRLYVFAVFFGLGWGGSNATFAALVSDVFGLRRLGVMVGMMDAGFSIGAALGPTFAGYIFDLRGSYVFAFLGGLLATSIATVLVFSLRMPQDAKTT